MLGAKPSILFASLFVLGSSSVYAVAPVNSNLVSIPIFRPGLEFSITALALKPGANNLNYAIFNKELPAESPSWTEKEIKPGFGFGFGLDASYIFAEGQDILLDWVHLNTGSSATVVAPNSSYFVGPDYQIGPESVPVRKAMGSSQFLYDVVHLDFGQYVNFGQHVQMRFFAGLSNAYLREHVNANFSGFLATGPFTGPFYTNQKVKADFFGLGPRIGMNLSYNTASGFGLLGEGAISALIGETYTKTSYASSATAVRVVFGTEINNQFIEDKEVPQVIPAIDAKLAATYKHQFSNCMLLTVTGGYQAAVYINAINEYLPSTLVAGTSIEVGGIFVGTMSHTQSNYSVQGPFLEAALEI